MNNSTPAPAGLIRVPGRAVPLEWIDYNGHMNVAFYSKAFDESLDVVLEEYLGLGTTCVKERGFGPYVVQNHIHYIAELLEGERLAVEFQMIDSDAKRIHCFLRMLREGPEEVLVATSEQLLVNVDLATRRSAPYPEDLLANVVAVTEAHASLPVPEQVGHSLGIRRSKTA